MSMQKQFDVIIVGAGPGGSSMATFLSRQGISVLILDKAHFPRDKVCGDGLTPQALYWIDKLGCIDEVLSQCNAYITAGDIFINGEHVLTGSFPDNTSYPNFCTLLERSKLDHILVRKAVATGAVFKPGCQVEDIHTDSNGVEVRAKSDGRDVTFRSKILIGADGSNSVVSRSIGNTLRDGATAISVRAYYNNVDVKASPMQVYFDEHFFPGYGWVFADATGKANIGVGYASDNKFPQKSNLNKVFNYFINNELKDMLKNATPLGSSKGWWISFYRPKNIVAERILLVGDAANMGDPINGGGIHKAMECANIASQAVIQALQSGDFSSQSLSKYEKMWEEETGQDWRTAELLLTIAKNPNLREFYVYMLKSIAGLVKNNPDFKDFCGAIFSGMISTSKCISPLALLEVLPRDPLLWMSAFGINGTTGAGISRQAIGVLRSSFKMGSRMAVEPFTNFEWGMEVILKSLGLAGCVAQSLVNDMAGVAANSALELNHYIGRRDAESSYAIA